ncbi:DUF559 domain-containing protein [Microtetraspora sp. NBRC 13810]|uniref:endonuclease domain-containing protein n=1 Tax=Microtetraspora sp. NBRC 13810 TaxID=3030990 RepID=UPI002553B9F0|nr:DUF559 domain-containing protein [Microtetraspora sp. NBRC 13810]
MAGAVLDELETTAAGLYPAWLPEAEGIGPAGVRAVRVLALRAASTSRHFGPFLADLAESALLRRPRRRPGFTPEVRAAGLLRVLAAAYGRLRVTILVRVPAGLSAAEERALFAGCEWLAHRGGFGVLLAGAVLAAVDRVEVVRLPGATGPAPAVPVAPGRGAPGRSVPGGSVPVAGAPHPGSAAERKLEAALAECDWAAGREWNQTYRPHPLAEEFRLDLLWREERCVVEIDGDDHRGAAKFARDRRRDVRLQMDGYAVLRFTDSHVVTDTTSVVRQLERFLRDRRPGPLKG